MLTEDNKSRKKSVKIEENARVEEKLPVQEEEEIIDIQIALPKKKKFRVNGDPNKILELDISDMGIMERLEKGWANLQKEVEKIGVLDTDDEKFSEQLAAIDKAMRKHVDYIFDSNVSEVCAGKGKMIDPWQGQIRYEHILDSLLTLYADNIKHEYSKIKARTKKHTDKYTKR